jgi:hypothetical protein
VDKSGSELEMGLAGAVMVSKTFYIEQFAFSSWQLAKPKRTLMTRIDTDESEPSDQGTNGDCGNDRVVCARVLGISGVAVHARSIIAGHRASVGHGAVDYLSVVEYAAQQYSAAGQRCAVWAGSVWVLADRELDKEAEDLVLRRIRSPKLPQGYRDASPSTFAQGRDFGKSD